MAEETKDEKPKAEKKVKTQRAKKEDSGGMKNPFEGGLGFNIGKEGSFESKVKLPEMSMPKLSLPEMSFPMFDDEKKSKRKKSKEAEEEDE